MRESEQSTGTQTQSDAWDRASRPGTDKINAAKWSLTQWVCMLSGLANGWFLRALDLPYAGNEIATATVLITTVVIAGAVGISVTLAIAGLPSKRGATMNAATAAVAAISGTLVGAVAHPGLALGATVGTVFTAAAAWTTLTRRKRDEDQRRKAQAG